MIVRRAVFSDIADLYAGLGIATPRADEYLALARQLAIGTAWSFRPTVEGPIAALAGIVRELEGVTWFRSGAGAERAMPGLIRAFRALLAAEAAEYGLPIVTWEQEHNPVGQRIAAALGFSDTGRRHGSMQVWEWRHEYGGSCHQRGDRRRKHVAELQEREKGEGARG